MKKRGVNRHHVSHALFSTVGTSEHTASSPSGWTNFEHTFPGEIVTTEILIKTRTQITLSHNQSGTRDISAVVKITFFHRSDMQRLLINLVFLQLSSDLI
ncbi:MAG: hypothetical protein OEU84_12870 [Xanthomonadales bacterium]|nr:hypothetical protein [Xanthomonadales bacterium]